MNLSVRACQTMCPVWLQWRLYSVREDVLLFGHHSGDCIGSCNVNYGLCED
jgi:hypothetical protein